LSVRRIEKYVIPHTRSHIFRRHSLGDTLPYCRNLETRVTLPYSHQFLSASA